MSVEQTIMITLSVRQVRALSRAADMLRDVLDSSSLGIPEELAAAHLALVCALERAGEAER
jgi:hypothetical protein